MLGDWRLRNLQVDPPTHETVKADEIFSTQLSIITAPPNELSTLRPFLAEFPTGSDNFFAEKITVKYEDIFGNEYTTLYHPRETREFLWWQPDNLVPPTHPKSRFGDWIASSVGHIRAKRMPKKDESTS